MQAPEESTARDAIYQEIDPLAEGRKSVDSLNYNSHIEDAPASEALSPNLAFPYQDQFLTCQSHTALKSNESLFSDKSKVNLQSRDSK